MKYLDEYRNKDICQGISEKIKAISHKSIFLMEVCGTHTMAIGRYGIRKMLPENINLVSGPGCPVCVTPQEDIDKFIKLAKMNNCIILTFGDLMRVPGSYSSLEKERAEGANIRVVYSCFDSIKIAQENPDKEVVFLGVGFETTAPTIAVTISSARDRKISNFSIISAHKLVPPALSALAENKNTKISGFILPGHVSVIIGAKAYVELMEKYNISCVIVGFEPVDILYAIYLLVKQIEDRTPKVEIGYKRGVSFEGNGNAQGIISRVFDVTNSHWRGIGEIPNTGLKLKEEFKDFNAEEKFDLYVEPYQKSMACECGNILLGINLPKECLLFGKSCTPEHPIGPCMVSSEGSCAAYYKYER